MRYKELERRLFKQYKKEQMKNKVKEYATYGIIEEEWEEIERYIKEAIKLSRGK